MIKFLRILVAVVTVIAIALVAVLANMTLIEPWKPLSVSAALALASVLPLRDKWKRIAGTTKNVVNYVIHAFVVTVALAAIFYSVNYWAADDESLSREEVTVVRKYTETRYRSKRIRCNVYGRGEPYTVYFIDVRFANGMVKSRELTNKSYRTVGTGQTITLGLESGFFSIPVIKTNNRMADK